jgi:hypothetical protein
MHKEVAGFGDISNAALIKSADFAETVGMEGHYVAKCYDKNGNLKWEDTIDNLVMAIGKQLMLDTLLSGSAYTATVRMGLVSGASSPTYAAANTQGSHVGWIESGLANAPTYSGSRPTITFLSASSNGVASPSNVTTKTGTAAVTFTFTGSGTVAGCFININGSATIDDTAGTLYSAGSFTGGNKSVAATDQLNVTYSTTATS